MPQHKAPLPSATKLPEPRPGSKRAVPGNGTYITPPLMRKAGAIPAAAAAAASNAGRTTVMAVKVVEAAPVAAPLPPAAAPLVPSTFAAAASSSVPPLPKRERRKVPRKNPSPTSMDGYASSEGGSPPINLHGALPAAAMANMNLETLDISADAAQAQADVSALLSEEMSLELAAFSQEQASTTGGAGAGTGTFNPPGLSRHRSRRGSSTSLAELDALESKDLQQSAAAAPAPASSLSLAPLDDLTEAELEALPTDGQRRKVRHNLTERRRVDRMNQLFHRLAMAIIEETAAPAITMSGMDAAERSLTNDGKEIAKPKWSKADVLEGAINVVNDLRKQLAEERLARSLGVPVSDEADFADALDGPDDSDGSMQEADEEQATPFDTGYPEVPLSVLASNLSVFD